MKNLRESFVENLSETQQKAFKLLYKKIDDYQKKTGKAFEEFNCEDFNTFVRAELIGKSANSVLVKVSLLKKYAEYIGNNCVQLKRTDIIEMCSEVMKEKEIEDESQLKYVEWNDLKVGMNKITNEIDCAIICLIRLGIGQNKFKELAELKTSNIDIENRKIYLEDRTVDIKDDYVLQVLKDAMKQTTYTVMLHGGDKNEPKFSEYDFNMNCPYFIKQKPWSKNDNGLEPYKFSGITGRVFRVMQELCMDVSAINLLQSYATDRVLEQENEIGRELSIRECKEYLKHIKNYSSSYDITKIAKYVREKINN